VGRIAEQGVEVHFIEAKGLIHGLATMRAAFPTADRILRRAIALFADVMRN
jgi:acetyl esterase